MGIADRMLGKKTVNGNPHIEMVQPEAALPGGEVRIVGSALRPKELKRPQVRFGNRIGAVVVSSDQFLVARVPQDAESGSVVVATNGHLSNPHQIKLASRIADNLHPVANPAVDGEGNIFTTISGSRGQKVPVSVFKIDTNYAVKPYLADLMNATAIAFDRAGKMYVTSRYDGAVYQVAPNGTMTTYAESMGTATGLAFDASENLYVGDRSGTIFKVAPDRQIFVFATIEPSVSAYHLAVGPQGDLFITGPTTSSFDAIHRVDPQGNVSVFYRGLGRPQGLAFDADGNLYVAASLAGKPGITRITPSGKASVFVSGTNLVGLAFAPGGTMILSTTTSIYRLDCGLTGLLQRPDPLA